MVHLASGDDSCVDFKPVSTSRTVSNVFMVSRSIICPSQQDMLGDCQFNVGLHV